MSALALAVAPELTPRREHASRSEYESWVRSTFPGERGTISSRLFFYKRFVERWPDLEERFAAPLLVRLDLDADAAAGPGMRRGTSHEAGSYLAYLSLTHGMPMDADWVLARNFDSLFHPRIAPALGVDLDLLSTLDRRQQQLGYRSGRSALTWGVARLALWKGDPDITAITHQDLVSFSEEICRWSLLPEASVIRAAHIHSTRRVHEPSVLVSQFEKASLSRLHSLHVLMFNTGQICEPPFHGLKTRELWREELTPADTPPAIAARVNRWLTGRLQSTDRAESVRNARDAFRYFLRWLSQSHPEMANLAELTRAHAESYLSHLHQRINQRTGRPLSARTRYGYISPLLQFFRESSQWGWTDVPARPLLGRSDLPKLPMRLPRFIPRDELDRLMQAVDELDDPHQRAALLLLRWSGARRGEIARLALDCLDAHPDGYPRIRIPVGKTYTERMIPLHPRRRTSCAS